MSIKFEIKNVAEFTKAMQAKQRKAEQAISLGIREATFHIFNSVKESIARGTNAPVTVDTGRFLSSVDMEATGENESRVFTDLEYAKYLEYGTSKMSARPHFRNTANKEKAKVKDIMRAEISKI